MNILTSRNAMKRMPAGLMFFLVCKNIFQDAFVNKLPRQSENILNIQLIRLSSNFTSLKLK